MPKLETIHIYNPSTTQTLHLNSISGDSPVFHASFFMSKVRNSSRAAWYCIHVLSLHVHVHVHVLCMCICMWHLTLAYMYMCMYVHVCCMWPLTLAFDLGLRVKYSKGEETLVVLVGRFTTYSST